MPISITKVDRLELNPAVGVFDADSIFVISGLTQTADNAVSLTNDGTSTGTPLARLNAPVLGVPVYVPTEDGGWYEKGVPDYDSAGNIRLNIHVNASGPTAFRVALRHG
jgi:hypothetical protein